MPDPNPNPTPARPQEAGGGGNYSGGGGPQVVESTPRPDPTELTSRAVDALRIEMSKLFDTRLDCLEELTEERFKAVSEKLDVAEKLRLEQKVDTKVAVDAALAAAKEQVGQQSAAFTAETTKTERNFSDQLKGLQATFATATGAQDSRHNDLKDRVTRIEERKIGGQEIVTESRDNRNAVYAFIAAGATILASLLAVIGFLAANGGTP